MGKANDQNPVLTIHFGNPRRVYQAGDRVTGTVIYQVEEPDSNARLELKMSGKASVAFSRDIGGKRREHFIQNEYYFEKQLCLWPQRQTHDSPSQILGIGLHEFPFSFTLPHDIPSSFHCASGNIRYYLKASLKNSRKSTAVKEFFVVYAPLDLNHVPGATNSFDQEEEISLVCSCCVSGNVLAHVKLPKRVFVPGETIPVQADIINNSSARITKTYFALEQVAHCYARGKTDTLRKQLKGDRTRLEHPGISPGGSDTWTGKEMLQVPTAVPTGLRGSRIMDLEHQLVLYVVPSGLACTTRMDMNIVIGTVPLGQNEGAAEGSPDDVALEYGAGYSSMEGSKQNYPEHRQERHSPNTELTWESGYITSQV